MKRGNSHSDIVIKENRFSMSKRSQVAVFIILAIMLVVAGGIAFVITKQSYSNRTDSEFFSQQEIKPQLENIHSNILWCLDETSKQALDTIGAQGGYYNQPDQSYSKNSIPYYYYQGSYLMPSNEKITSELKDFAEEKVNVCLDGLGFDGFELKHSQPKANVIINQNEVVFEIDSSVIIEKDGKRSIFETKDYPVKKVSALSDILEIAKYITNSHKIDAKMYCISCIEKLAEEKDVYVQSIPISDDSVLIIIAENRTSDEPYLFSFLNKYTNKEISDDFALTGAYAEQSPESLGVV
jgi:hypothetical protein